MWTSVPDHGDNVDATSLASPNTRIYCCYKCNLLFSAHQDLTVHVQSKHGVTDIYTCSICESIFTSPANLSSHVKSHHTRVFFPQPYFMAPDAPSVNIQTFTRDYNHHNFMAEPVHCNSCDSTFADMRLLNIHTFEYHRNLKPYSCDKCECTFEDMGMLHKHLSSVHTETLDHSSVQRHPSQANLSPPSLPDQNCHNPRIFSCGICFMTFLASPQLKHHLQNYHGAHHNTAVCETCGKFFMDRSCLELHTRTDHEEQESSSFHCDSMSNTGECIYLHPPAVHRRPQDNELLYIRQYDGNDSIDSITTNATDSPQTMSELVVEEAPGPHDLRYNYSLNPENQSRRLVANAKKNNLSCHLQSS